MEAPTTLGDVDVPPEHLQEAAIVEQPVEAPRTLVVVVVVVDLVESSGYHTFGSNANQSHVEESLQYRVCWKGERQMEQIYCVVVEKMPSDEMNQ